MGAIKDIIDLTTQLSSSVKDRKLAGEISQIQSLISSVQIDNANLVSENLELKKQIFELEKAQSEKASKIKDKYLFNKKYGVYESNDSGHYFCTSCLLNGIESPLSENRAGWRCELKQCEKFYGNPSYTPSSIESDYDPGY